MPLVDQTAGVMVGIGQCQLEQAEHVNFQHSNGDQTAKLGVTLEQMLLVLER